MEKVITKLVHEYEQGRMSRRQLIQSLAVTATATATFVGAKPAAAAEGKGFKAIGVNHISYEVADYAKTRDFYADLLGMPVHGDDGKQCYLKVGDTILIPRNRGTNTPRIDHIAYTIADWDKDAVEAELKRRGLKPTPDTDDSFHVEDVNGYDLQISGTGMKL